MTISQESDVRPLLIIEPAEPGTAETVTEALEKYRDRMLETPVVALKSLRRFMGATTEDETAVEDEDDTWSTMWTALAEEYALDFGFDRVTRVGVSREPKFKEAQKITDRRDKARQLTLLTLEHFLGRVENYRQLGKTALDTTE